MSDYIGSHEEAMDIARAIGARDREIARLRKVEKAAQAALNYMRLHKYADQAWADDLEAALNKESAT